MDRNIVDRNIVDRSIAARRIAARSIVDRNIEARNIVVPRRKLAAAMIVLLIWSGRSRRCSARYAS